jgi:hypothetical protein
MNATVSLAMLIGAAVVALSALALALMALWRQRAMQRRYLRLFGAEEQGTVSDILAAYAARVEAVAEDSRAGGERIAALELGLRGCLQCASVMRFNPFTDTGGDQSFVLVLADGQGDGAVLSSLHARGLTRIYAKPLVGWVSPHQLSTEEAEALDQARANQSTT